MILFSVSAMAADCYEKVTNTGLDPQAPDWKYIGQEGVLKDAYACTNQYALLIFTIILK